MDGDDRIRAVCSSLSLEGPAMLSNDHWDDLVGLIYEAGALPARWPEVLEVVANSIGARGGNLIKSCAGRLTFQTSPSLEQATRDFDREGWNEHNSRVARLLARSDYGGFLTDSHLHSEAELASLPMYTQFLNPRGVAAGAATVIQGAADDGLILAIEAFSTHATSRAATPYLDRLRPHLARAAVLSSQVHSARISNLVDAFKAISTPIGLLSVKGKLIGANSRFQALMDGIMTDTSSKLRMIDSASDDIFAAALARVAAGQPGASLVIRDESGDRARVLHLIPARNEARDLFHEASVFAVIAQPGNEALPTADIISALFDLTPAEARVARGIAQGLSILELAERLGVTSQTIRSHLKRVFVKTSTNRQIELSRLISQFASPLYDAAAATSYTDVPRGR